MKFQIGKYYQHSGGGVLSIIGTANTFYHGACLLGEDDAGTLMPIGADEAAAANWHEVSGWPADVYEGNSIPQAVRSKDVGAIQSENAEPNHE